MFTRTNPESVGIEVGHSSASVYVYVAESDLQRSVAVDWWSSVVQIGWIDVIGIWVERHQTSREWIEDELIEEAVIRSEKRFDIVDWHLEIGHFQRGRHSTNQLE